MSETEEAAIPTHIGYIVDGNRRWAKQHGLPTYEGHLAGYNAMKDIARESFERGVRYVSAYTFSTENWQRNRDEVKGIMKLVLKLMTSDLHFFDEHEIRLIVIGSREGVDQSIVDAIDAAERQTAGYTKGTFVMCFNYGGQLEIAEACKKIVQAGIRPDDITPDLVASQLYAPDVPPCDIIVRTSGEQRLSNFMLWRAAYSELLFVDKPWPDMTKDDVSAIIETYSNRNRRFGK